MDRKQLVAELNKMGIAVKDGRVKKSDIMANISATPKLYLSQFTSYSGDMMWTVMYQSQPLMADTKNKSDAIKVLQDNAKKLRIKTPEEFWDGNAGKFIKMETLAASKQEIDKLFHKNESVEEELFTLGDIKGFGMDDSIILSKMIGANIKHLGLRGSKAKEYREAVMKIIYE